MRSRSPAAEESEEERARARIREEEQQKREEKEEVENEDDEDLYGPQLPSQLGSQLGSSSRSQPGQRSGPTIPTVQDLQLQRGELFFPHSLPYYLSILLKHLSVPYRIRPCRRTRCPRRGTETASRRDQSAQGRDARHGRRACASR